MFLSLKWKAVVFLSVVLITITVAWVAQHIYKTITTYEARIEESQARQQLILRQLLNDNALRLSQLSQLIAEIPDIQRAPESAPYAPLRSGLKDEWIKLNINTGIDYIGLYSIDNVLIGDAFNEVLFDDPDALHRAIAEAMAGEDRRGTHSFIYCGMGCAQFVIEPFVLGNGTEALMLTGQNMAEVIQRYQQMSSKDLALLLPQPDEEHTQLPHDRYLDTWNLRLWAASRFQETFKKLKQLQQSTSFPGLISGQPFDYDTLKLLFNRLDLTGYDTFGVTPHVISISDETQQYRNLVNSVKVSVAIGVLALLVSELILILLMLSPLKRLASVVDALTLLPKHEYGKAHRRVQDRPSFFKDELSLLEKSTQFVTRELEQLHIEVEEKNLSLRNQIAIISRSRAFLERLIDSSHLFIVTQQLDGKILTTNARFENEFHRPFTSFSELFVTEDCYETYSDKVEWLKRGQCEVIQFDAEFANDQGHTIYIDWTCSVLEDETGRNIILAIGIDLTQRKRDEEALEWLANNDPLTGIGNRRGFQHDLQKMLDTQSVGAIIFIDVNRFKQINDLYGHNVGDRVLVQIASALRSSVRSSDSISRLAGDEFTVILADMKAGQLERFLQKLYKQLNGQVPLPGEDRVVEYNVSVGAALIPDHGTTEQELIVHADMAMYQAKKKGAEQWQIFDPDNNNLEELRRDHDLTSVLKQALKRNDLFELHYQAIYSIHEASVSHFEVLLRLKDTEGRAIYPDEFIPAAERMGLIRQVDEWVMEHAVHKLAQEISAGNELSFSINVSAPTLQSGNFPETLIDLIHKYQVDPGHIVVELTETAYIENFQMVLTNLEQISKAGVLVALDDFGVGFSSFSYLKKLPLSYVKLDGSYIKDLENNRDNQVFVESLTNMVNAFGMQTIAEFVEDVETLNKLEELGVAYAQGYYIGRPSPKISEMVAGAGFEPTTFGL